MLEKHLVSSATSQCRNNKGIYDLLNIMHEVGFKAYDFTMVMSPIVTDVFFDKDDYIERAKQLREYADNLGMVCNQTHSNFPVERPTYSIEEKEYQFKLLLRCIEITGILGAKYCVVHPINYQDDEYNAKFIKRMLPTAHKCGVHLAIENMWNWDKENDHARLAACSNHNNFSHLLELINDEYAVAVVDIGHAEMKGLNTDAATMIKTLGNKVHCLHIHDNDKWHDEHKLPGEGLIDFDKVIDALVDINYKGDFTMEVSNPLDNLPRESIKEEFAKIRQKAEELRDKYIERSKN